MLHVCKGPFIHMYKKLNHCYERGDCSGLKYLKKTCKYLGMVKQWLLHNIYARVVDISKGRKALSLLPGNLQRIIIFQLFMWSSAFWEKWEWEQRTGETWPWKVKWKSEVRACWISLISYNILKLWINVLLWTNLALPSSVWVEINFFGFYQDRLMCRWGK